MEGFTRRDLLRMFPLIFTANELLKTSKKYFPEAPYVSESIAINEKFLSHKKQLEKSTDKRIPDDLSFFIRDMAGAMLKACIAISREEEAIKIEELFLRNNHLFSQN